MNILFISGSLLKGGAERVTSKLCNHFASQGHNVHIACLLNSSVEYPLDQRVTIVDLTQTKRTLFSLIKWVSRLKKHIQSFKPDIIISFAGRVNLVALLASKKNSVIVSERNDPRYDNRGKLALLACKRLYKRKAKKIVFQTKEVQTLFSKKVIEKSVIIANPITKPLAIKTDYSTNNSIIMVGRLDEQKNYKLALEAFSKIKQKYNNLSLNIYGVGNQKDVLVDFAKSRGIEHNVVFHGLCDDIKTKLVDSSVFLLTSKYEGLSNALMEAMSVGVPCISTPVSGSNEIIENNVNGVLLPDFNVESVINALDMLLKSKETREKIGKKAISSMNKFEDGQIYNLWDSILN